MTLGQCSNVPVPGFHCVSVYWTISKKYFTAPHLDTQNSPNSPPLLPFANRRTMGMPTLSI